MAANAQGRNRILIDVVPDKGVLFCNVLFSANTGAFLFWLLLHSDSNKAGPRLVERISQAQQTEIKLPTVQRRIAKEFAKLVAIPLLGRVDFLFCFCSYALFSPCSKKETKFLCYGEEKNVSLLERDRAKKKSPTTITRPAV